MHMAKKILIAQLLLLAILIVLFVAYLRTSSVPEVPSFFIASSTPLQMGADSFKEVSLINESVISDMDKHYIINFKPLKAQLVKLQNKQIQKTYIYFAYLNNTSWIGLNEKDFFTAASTIKVPLAMSIAKMEEDGKLKSTDLYSLIDLDLDPAFGDLYKVGSDKSFTVDELVQIMLMHSDNTAMQALFHVMELIGVHDPLASVYDAMGWDYNGFGNKATYIDINLKTLSNIFMALYNASYLNVSDSQKILAYLAQTDFNDQIMAGLPKGAIVSHKIGLNEKNKTYSDCGIVYAPNRPYILCVGSSGLDKKASNAFTQDVSKAVYQYIINN